MTPSRAVLDKLARYCVTGGIAAVVDAGGFALLIRTNGPVVAMAAISFCVAAAVNYLLTSRIVFTRRSSRKGFLLFFGVALVGLAANVGMTTLGVAMLGLRPVVAKIAAIGVAFLLNFMLNLTIVFPSTGDATEAGTSQRRQAVGRREIWRE